MRIQVGMEQQEQDLFTPDPPGLCQADVAHLLPAGSQQAKGNHSLESRAQPASPCDLRTEPSHKPQWNPGKTRLRNAQPH